MHLKCIQSGQSTQSTVRHLLKILDRQGVQGVHADTHDNEVN